MGETKSLLSHAPLRGLPPELLDMVMFYVRDEKDLVSICNSSRALYQSARFALYKSINTTLEEKPTYTLPGVVMLNFAQHVKLYQTLRRPGVAHLVTSFQVCIVVQDHSNGSECSCDPFDSMLGEALQALINLQELYFECHCCKGRKRQRHRYLETLKARKIRQFLFYCYCSPDEAEYIRKISTAPCFQGVTSLALRSMYGEHPECADVAAKETLPKLKKLMCSYILPVLESLFAKGTVTHFICYSRCGAKDFDLLHSIVEKHPGVLHHLVISAYRGQRPYFAFKDPAPYLNLRHFGTFIFHVVTLSPEEFNKSISSLAALPKLSSFELKINQGFSQVYDNEICDYLKDATILSSINSLPLLERIYATINPHQLTGNPDLVCWVWNLREEGWIGEVIPDFDSWDIMQTR